MKLVTFGMATKVVVIIEQQDAGLGAHFLAIEVGGPNMASSKHMNQQDIKDAAPRSTEWEMRDSRVIGLVLRIAPTGRKTWSVRYTPPGGSRNNKKLGTYPTMTVAMARAQALKVLGQATAGKDPGRDARREKRATLGVYVRGQYTEYAQANLLRHRAALQGIESDFGTLFNKPMTEISEMDVQRWRARRAKGHRAAGEGWCSRPRLQARKSDRSKQRGAI